MQSILDGGKEKENFIKRCRDRIPRKWLKRDNLLLLVLFGVLLLVAAIPLDQKKPDAQTQEEENGTLQPSYAGSEKDSAAAAGGGMENGGEMTDMEYAAWLEERLTNALSRVEGIGEVQVMITLSASREIMTERETNVTRSATSETDSQGGSRRISQTQTTETVICSSEGNGSEPYVVKILPPKVEGILVVAEGAGTGSVDSTVTAVAWALFGVEAHKVSVVRMETK